MKVTITDREKKEVEREYPYWGVHKDGSIVVFKAQGEGFCIIDNKNRFNTSLYSKTWAENLYTPLVNKTITIEV